jgi:hypothetical protein
VLDPFRMRFSTFGYLALTILRAFVAREDRVMLAKEEAPIIGKGGVLAAIAELMTKAIERTVREGKASCP